MNEKEIMIDPCYVIGTALIYKNSLDRPFFDRVESELSKYYDIDLSEKSVISSVEEWKDFFRMTSDGRVILTEPSIKDKTLIRILFVSALQGKVYDDVESAILNKKVNKGKTKILRFPK